MAEAMKDAPTLGTSPVCSGCMSEDQCDLKWNKQEEQDMQHSGGQCQAIW